MSQGSDCLAVSVKNICFGYSESNLILDNVCLSVPQNTIYGLLGPSGCGKTTLLKCILGMLKPKSGECSIFGQRPGDGDCFVPGSGVGYMPQELALYMDFTIEESLRYFGRLFNMSSFEISKRIEFLLQLLRLPKKNKLVSKLSAGQQRRVSMALALIHSPPLLILDEPTVGVDPVLRKTIWNHLIQLCNDGITIILTTHYSEEARAAARVGFMNEGRLLTEENPQKLLKEYNTSTLEEIFFILCQQDNTLAIKCSDVNHNVNSKQQQDEETPLQNLIDENTPDHFEMNDIKSRAEASFNNNYNYTVSQNNYFDRIKYQSTTMSRLESLVTKNFRKLSRSIVSLIFFVGLPASQFFLILICIGSGVHDLDLAVYNEEGPGKFGQIFLDSIDKSMVNLHYYDSFEEAYQQVEDGKMWAALDIGHRFTPALKMRVTSGLFSEVDNQTVKDSEIIVHMDHSNQLIAMEISKIFVFGLFSFMEKVFGDLGLNPDGAKTIVKFEEPVYGFNVLTLDWKPYLIIVPGLYCLICFFTISGFTLNLLIDERQDGLYDRSRVAGVRPVEIVLGILTVLLVIVLVQTVLVLIISLMIFEVPMYGSTALVILLMLSQGLAGMCFGMFISTLTKDQHYGDVFMFSAFFPSALMAGIFFPLESMPSYIQFISKFLPPTLPCEAMRSIIYRGWDLSYPQVQLGFAVNYLWVLAFVVMTVYFMRKNS